MAHTDGVWLFRSDPVISHLAIQRFARLFDDRVAFYKEPDGEPEFELKINRRLQTPGPLYDDEFDIKPPGASRLSAILLHSLTTEKLFAFKLTKDVSEKSYFKSRTQSMTLAFKDATAAEEFRAALVSKLEGCERGASSAVLEDLDYMVVSKSEGADGSSKLADGESAFQVASELAVVDEAIDYASMQPAVQTLLAANKWSSKTHWNGLSTYEESSPGGARMICCNINASPLDVFAHIVVRKDGRCGWAFKRTTIVEKHEDDIHKLVFRTFLPEPTNGWRAAVLSSGLVAHREVVLQQTWSHNETDGSFTIICQSVPHDGSSPEPPGAAARVAGPVQAKLQHLSFTISPLREDILQGASPRECLLTILIQFADLGGWMQPASLLRTLLQPLASTWLWGTLHAIVQMRDELELNRFAVPPFPLMSSGLDQPGAQRALQSQQTFRQGKPVAPGVDPAEDDSVSFTSAESAEAAAPVETWLPRRYYSSPDGSGWKLRGATYLDDRKKVPAGDPAFSLEGVEVCTTAEADLRHISQYLPIVMHSRKAYQIVVHFMMPYGGNNMHLAVVFASASLPPESEAEADPFALALGRFVAGDGPDHDARRDKTFKLIPKVAEGAWVVRQAVGSTPCIIGTKLATTYHRGRNPPYLEVSVDINSNTTAASITSFVGGYMNSLNIHLAFLLEGKTPAELPEQLLGTVALDHVELQEAKAIDTSAPLVPQR